MPKRVKCMRLSGETLELLEEVKKLLEEMDQSATYDQIIRRALRMLLERLKGYTIPF